MQKKIQIIVKNISPKVTLQQQVLDQLMKLIERLKNQETIIMWNFSTEGQCARLKPERIPFDPEGFHHFFKILNNGK